MDIYIIYEFLNEKWQQRNIFNSFGKAMNFVHQAREWESRWEEQGFAFAPKPGIYKIVRFTETQTITIEQ